MTKEDLTKLREATAAHLAFRRGLGTYNSEAESIISLLDGQVKIMDYLLADPKRK